VRTSSLGHDILNRLVLVRLRNPCDQHGRLDVAESATSDGPYQPSRSNQRRSPTTRARAGTWPDIRIVFPGNAGADDGRIDP
jgi:hypothetical protein